MDLKLVLFILLFSVVDCHGLEDDYNYDSNLGDLMADGKEQKGDIDGGKVEDKAPIISLLADGFRDQLFESNEY